MIDVIPWDDVYTHDDAEQAYQSFFMSFNAIFNKGFPLVNNPTKRIVLPENPDLPQVFAS